jgi:hypothetical protein
MYRASAAALLGCLLAAAAIPEALRAQEQFGSFEGDLVVKVLDDGRKVRLAHPFAFKDPAGKLWSVPTGAVVDGASIPEAFWSFIGGPFEGKYREASVIHDHYCVEQTETWENVHLAFYNGMRANGVGPVQAKIMYGAVYNFGPRWLEVRPGERGTLISGRPILLEEAKKAIIKFITDNDPSIEEIREVSAKLAQVESISQLEQLLFENANCTAILTDASVEPDVKRTLVLCGLSKASKKHAALKNLRTLVAHLRELLRTQRAFLLPKIEAYVASPSPDKWSEIQQWSRNVHGLIKLGIRSVLDVEDDTATTMAPPVDNVFNILNMRAAMISPILSGPPKSKDEMQRWTSQYLQLVRALEGKLSNLEKHLQTVSR